jgi:hypothetical protein
MEHEDWVEAVAFSPDGKWLATGSRDGTVRVWEAATKQEVTAPMVHESTVKAIAFSPDGKWLATGSEDWKSDSGEARVWEAATGQEVTDPLVHEHRVYAIAFSSDGKWLATGSAEATARVWETATWQGVARMEHEDSVFAVAFSPDGKWLATGSKDDTARIWLLRSEDLIAEACARLTRNLTPVEWRQYIGDEEYRPTCPDLPVHPSVIEDMVDHKEYTQAVQLAIETNDAFLNDKICWWGSLDGFAEVVLPACERAVELEPDYGYYLDSRGLARTLTGDYVGATRDFKLAVERWKEEGRYERYGPKREAWIAELEAGQNPIDSATLEELR